MQEKFNKNNLENIVQKPEPSEEGISPILEHAEEIKEIILNNQTAIIMGETGSGKTTEIPLIIDKITKPNDNMAISEPRAQIARSVCRYVAHKDKSPVGGRIGYRVRFDNRTNEGTKINFMTDGILLRLLQDDPLLKNYSVVMLDEAHERQINTDILKGALKLLRKLNIREKRGLPPLKEITTSATLEKEKFIKFDEGKNNYRRKRNSWL